MGRLVKDQLSNVAAATKKPAARIRAGIAALVTIVNSLIPGNAAAGVSAPPTRASIESRVAAVRMALNARDARSTDADESPDQTFQWGNWNNWPNWGNWNNWPNWGNWANY